MKVKKLLSLFLAGTMMVGCLAGCGSDAEAAMRLQEQKRKHLQILPEAKRATIAEVRKAAAKRCLLQL